MQPNTLSCLDHHRPGMTIALLRNPSVVATGGRLPGGWNQAEVARSMGPIPEPAHLAQRRQERLRYYQIYAWEREEQLHLGIDIPVLCEYGVLPCNLFFHGGQ